MTAPLNHILKKGLSPPLTSLEEAQAADLKTLMEATLFSSIVLLS